MARPMRTLQTRATDGPADAWRHVVLRGQEEVKKTKRRLQNRNPTTGLNHLRRAGPACGGALLRVEVQRAMTQLSPLQVLKLLANHQSWG